MSRYGTCQHQKYNNTWFAKDDDMVHADNIGKHVHHRFYAPRIGDTDICIPNPGQVQHVLPAKVPQPCLNPHRPVQIRDDLLEGRVHDPNMNSTNDRCKLSDPFHVRYKRFVAPLEPAGMRQRVADCCARADVEPCAGYLCTPAGWIDKTSNYYQQSGKNNRQPKCRYPLPCKAHCYESNPRGNTWDPLVESTACIDPITGRKPPKCQSVGDSTRSESATPKKRYDQRPSSDDASKAPTSDTRPHLKVTFQDQETNTDDAPSTPTSRRRAPRTLRVSRSGRRPLPEVMEVREPRKYRYTMPRPRQTEQEDEHLEYTLRAQAPSQPAVDQVNY